MALSAANEWHYPCGSRPASEASGAGWHYPSQTNGTIRRKRMALPAANEWHYSPQMNGTIHAVAEPRAKRAGRESFYFVDGGVGGVFGDNISVPRRGSEILSSKSVLWPILVFSSKS